jgi:Spy/CpxP family protein refolding chaperone
MGLALALALSAAAQPGPGGMGHGPMGPGGPGGPEDGGMGMFLSPRMFHELNLSPDQEKKLRDIHLAAEKKKIQLHAQKATLELDLKNSLSIYPVNKSEAMALAEKIADVDKQITLFRVETLTQVLGNLTGDQHAKLQTLQEEWMEKRRAWRDEWEKDHPGRRGGKDQRQGPPDQGQ